MNILLNAITLAAKNKELTLQQIVDSYNQGSQTKYQIQKIEEKKIQVLDKVEDTLQNTYVDTRTESITNIKPPIEVQKPNNFSPVAIIGGIGTFIVAIGSGILIGTNWQTMSINQQLFSSLGIGLILFYISYFLSLRYKYNIVSNILIVISGLWLSWGLLYSVDKTVGDKGGKILVFGILLLVLTVIYTLLYRYIDKSLYYMALSATGFASYMMLTNYIILNADSENFGKLLTLGFITASLASLLLLAYNYRNLVGWVRDLTLFGQYSVFGIASYAYLVELDRSWVGGNQRVAEIVYGLFFVVWYWIAIKNQSRILLVINSIAVYIYLYTLSAKYFDNSNFAVSLIIGGMGLIGISLATYYISQTMSKKQTS